MKRLAISFSGGETSADMTMWCLEHMVQDYDEHVVVFANTGWENEKTLDFVHKCDRQYGFNTVWIEAQVHHGERRASSAKVVTYETASRHQEPFREVVRKYGIPNSERRHCTRELKGNPIRNYCRKVLGWGTAYDTAIGIRADEIDRMKPYEPGRLVYPFISRFPTTKPQINARWAARPFRLGLRGYQGNCQACFAKSLRKLLTIMDENPASFDFARETERDFGRVGPEFEKMEPAAYEERRWYRRRMSVADIENELVTAQITDAFRAADDDAQVFDLDLDVDGACGSEACEPFVNDDDE